MPMKMLMPLISTIATPAFLIGTINALPSQASKLDTVASFPSLPPILPDIQSHIHIWVKLAKPTTINSIADKLGLSRSMLSELNELPAASHITSGNWLLLPATTHARLKQIKSITQASIRHTPPPITSPLPPSNMVRFRSGDSIAEIGRQHGITIDKIRKLNPRLDLENLTIGSKIRLVKSTQTLSAIRPIRIDKPIWPDLSRLSELNEYSQVRGSEEFIWPTKGVLTSGFGWRWGRMHQGIDIANKIGTNVFASKNGMVTFAGWKGAYGYLVEISHADGDLTRYAHNSKLLVKKGQIIPQGITIAKMGSTGRSTGPHLHFEIRKKSGSPINPINHLPLKTATSFSNLDYCYHPEGDTHVHHG